MSDVSYHGRRPAHSKNRPIVRKLLDLLATADSPFRDWRSACNSAAAKPPDSTSAANGFVTDRSIGDHALLSDRHSSALVSGAGSIDWLPAPLRYTVGVRAPARRRSGSLVTSPLRGNIKAPLPTRNSHTRDAIHHTHGDGHADRSVGLRRPLAQTGDLHRLSAGERTKQRLLDESGCSSAAPGCEHEHLGDPGVRCGVDPASLSRAAIVSETRIARTMSRVAGGTTTLRVGKRESSLVRAEGALSEVHPAASDLRNLFSASESRSTAMTDRRTSMPPNSAGYRWWASSARARNTGTSLAFLNGRRRPGPYISPRPRRSCGPAGYACGGR